MNKYEKLIRALQCNGDGIAEEADGLGCANKKCKYRDADGACDLISMTLDAVAAITAIQSENAELKKQVEAKEAILRLYEPTLSLVAGDKDTAIHRMIKAEAALARVEAERDAASNTKLELFFGRGELGVDTVAEDEDSPLREILIRRLQSPVIPIGSALGDKGKTVDELENILMRMHFENVESALVLERALQIVLGSFEEPRRGAQGEG